jgi:LacI family transcriptional regulator
MTLTMSDVAKKASVSTATVSRVLSGKPSLIPISEETKERVLQVAREMGYQLDPVARALRTGRSQILGVIVRDTADPFFGLIIKAIENKARDLGYQVMLGSIDLEPDHATSFQRAFSLRLCDGVIIIGHLPGDEHIVSNLAATSQYAVGVTRLMACDLFPCIGFDNIKAATLAMEHLLELGHQRIAYIGITHLPSFQQRLQVFEEFMAAKGLPVPPDFIRFASRQDAEGGYQAMKELLNLPEIPGAVFVCNDYMAMGALSAAFEMGVSVPETISVIGFDDIRISRYLNPPLTTIHFPAAEMGTLAVEVLMQLLDKGETKLDLENIVLDPQLIIRGSTAPPGGK